MFYALVAGLFLWHITALLLGVKLARGRFLRKSTGWLVGTLVALLMANWIYRLATGLQ